MQPKADRGRQRQAEEAKSTVNYRVAELPMCDATITGHAEKSIALDLQGLSGGVRAREEIGGTCGPERQSDRKTGKEADR
jgi:hypothetical protein